MKNIKKLLILLTIMALTIIIIMIVIFTMGNSNDNNNIVTIDTNQTMEQDLPDATVEKVTAENVEILKDRNKFFSIEKMINSYFLYVRAGNARSSIFYIR